VDDELRTLLEQLVTANARNEQMVAELAGVIETLLTILQKKGELDEGHLRVIAKLRKHAKLVTTPKIELDNTTDKYTMEAAPPIDCDARMHLCHGRCCGFEVRLSRQDLEEGKLEWKIDHPYYLARDQTGFCVYQDKDTGYCGNYDHRPAACRRYDCREDARVWVDFEKMIPAAMPSTLVTIRRRPKAGA
jgi:Fe-S-cluster containining protein